MSSSANQALMNMEGVVVERTIHYENWLTEGEVELLLTSEGGKSVIRVRLQDSQNRSLTSECLRAARILTRTVGNIVGIDASESDTDGGTTRFTLKLKDGITDQEAADVLRLFTKLWGDDLNAVQRSRANIRSWFSETADVG